MKKSKEILSGIALCLLSITMHAQTVPQSSLPEKNWNAKTNSTVDSITSHYTGKYIAPLPALTSADIFPVIGQYESATVTGIVNITLDPDNKGLVWIEGLPQGKIKAMLRKSPATYKIPAQKTADDKNVAEGTLILDTETKELSICLGKDFNAENPGLAIKTAIAELETATAAAKKDSKSKKQGINKIWIYTGTKLTTETVLN